MANTVLVAGGGIAGMAVGVATARAGWAVQVFESTPAFSEVGAGVQLGPNVTRLLQSWKLGSELEQVAAFPESLRARTWQGELLATLPLGAAAHARYGAPYATLHRAHLHALLLQAAQQQGVLIWTASTVCKLENQANGILAQVRGEGGVQHHEADAAVVSDGVWSQLRQDLWQGGPAQPTGHVAYRTLVRQADLPVHARSQDVTVWMGPKAHVVHYPVHGGDWLNVVCLTEAQGPGSGAQADPSWQLTASDQQLQRGLQAAMHSACYDLQEVLASCTNWRMWPLYARSAMRSAHEHAKGRIALVGDAAHPMLPYLAQGAGMAMEDAAELASQLQDAQTGAVATRLQAFAQARWQRNARVQAQAVRNAEIFHAQGLLRWARNAALRWRGAQLMDMPWLYGYPSPS